MLHGFVGHCFIILLVEPLGIRIVPTCNPFSISICLLLDLGMNILSYIPEANRTVVANASFTLTEPLHSVGGDDRMNGLCIR